jgi:hypothetical protein
MPSTPASKETDPHDTFEIKPDVVLAARADKTSSKPANDGRPSAAQDRTTSGVSAGASAPSLDTTFRAAAVDNIKVARDRPATGKWARRALLSFLFALCSAFATAGWTHYGDAAKAMIMSWAPQFVLTSSQPQQTPEAAEQASSPTLQAGAADPAAAPPVQSAQNIAPPVAALPAESAQLLQSMSQQIEELKASIEQLKTGQEQISREIARNSEIKTAPVRAFAQNPRPRMPPPPLRSVAAPARKPVLAYAPAQAATAPALPQTAAATPVVPRQPGPSAQATAQPEVDPVARPPMPVHSSP